MSRRKIHMLQEVLKMIIERMMRMNLVRDTSKSDAKLNEDS